MLNQTVKLTEGSQLIEVTQDSLYSIVYIGEPETALKSHLEIVHKTPYLKSRVNIRAIIFGDAKFDLEAILKINKGAYQTDTYLKIDCLVVGDNAFARAIPSLEIKESDVKGGHGATIGYIDEIQLNYLYSKGLDKKVSEELLIKAFLNQSTN